MDILNPTTDRKEALLPTGYQPPVVEIVLTADSLVREVHYAGKPSIFG